MLRYLQPFTFSTPRALVPVVWVIPTGHLQPLYPHSNNLKKHYKHKYNAIMIRISNRPCLRKHNVPMFKTFP